jgi:hypothetical protein
MFSNIRIETDPYPYIVWDKLLSDDEYTVLSSTMPEHIEWNYAVNIMQHENEAWKLYTNKMTSIDFHAQLLELFGLKIDNSVGLRKRDIAQFVTESFVAIRKPTGPTVWCLNPHCDSKYAVTSMVHYFKADDDTDNSGDFVILRPIAPIKYITSDSRITYADPDCFEIVETIPYGKNNAVCTLATPDSWHAILPRNNNIRRTVNISYERAKL